MTDEVHGGGGLPDCISCYRIMTRGSHYNGSCFLLLRLVGLVIRGRGDRWDRERRDVVGRMIFTGD